ncbi:FKBP-type peptidyl-prolyl cis-trans isomerase [Porticoccus sp. W117]|uniref:FKBP-type peptidyl-prolyl cis-trans isomerase n=1 Tax=Porticoccus sp. W117 TaxID=3054777 RepID=UPI0025955DE5|nr:FKBP-type peptidyl-prolyl cis-trans isomerase [Porticoccus sp. W117]MDM3871264.1 FKBP-type peptidyl-prolyl cis-trans isomerase [Porticoccus sp. W117]
MIECIAEGAKVTLHFSLSLEDGQLVDSNFDGEPATFTVGDGSLLPGFEQSLFGLKAAEKRQFAVAPENGFGQPNPNNIQQVDRTNFDTDTQLESGLVMTFLDANKVEVPGVVTEFDEKTVTVDFNHPLAGRTILFDVHILSVTAS